MLIFSQILNKLRVPFFKSFLNAIIFQVGLFSRYFHRPVAFQNHHHCYRVSVYTDLVAFFQLGKTVLIFLLSFTGHYGGLHYFIVALPGPAIKLYY